MSRDSFWQNYLKSLPSKRKVYFTVFHHYFNFFHFFFNITCIYWLGFWVITILPVCCKVDSAHTNMCAESCTHVCITQQEIFFFHLSPVIFHPHTLNLSIIVRNEKRAQEQPGMTLELHMKILWSWQTACAVLKNLGQGCLLSGCTSCSISFNASPFSDELASARKGENRSELCYRCRTQKSTNMN